MNFNKQYFQYMPFLSAAACLPGVCDNGSSVFPTTDAMCVCEVAAGGINEFYYLPCDFIFSEVNLLDVSKWQDLVDDGKLGRSGLVIGSLGQKSVKTDKLASCRVEQMTAMVWAIKAVQKCFDKTSARSHCAKNNELIKKFDKYLLVARMCEGDNTILPVGVFTTSAFNWIVPEDSQDNQSTEIEYSWKELGMPCTMDVPGLSAVIPKLS
jgi:hypothetical protein